MNLSSQDTDFEQHRFLFQVVNDGHLIWALARAWSQLRTTRWRRADSPCFWCHLAGYHQQWLTSRDRMKVWLSADHWQDMQLLCKWPVLQRKTTGTMPQLNFFSSQPNFFHLLFKTTVVVIWGGCVKDTLWFHRGLWIKMNCANSLSNQGGEIVEWIDIL